MAATGNRKSTVPAQAPSRSKHISRLTREMYELRLKNNPFSSPPSSTGSHDTVSTTTEELTNDISAFSFSPDGEGTRRLNDDLLLPPRGAARSGRFNARRPTNPALNTSAIARAFPEWSGLVANKDATTFSNRSIEMTPPADNDDNDDTMPSVDGRKENRPPPPILPTIEDDTTTNHLDLGVDHARKRSRSDMQARVDNESDCSSVLSRTPLRPVATSRRSRLGRAREEVSASPEPRRQSLQDLVTKIRGVQQLVREQTPPQTASSKPSPVPGEDEGGGVAADPHGANTSALNTDGRSFFLPPFRHLPDWTSGILKFSSMRNGIPVFVKAGTGNSANAKSRVRFGQVQEYGSVNAVNVPEDDEEIFVSLDKLQEEVRDLHDHDSMLQREAEKLQREVMLLQTEVKRLKSKGHPDSAIGSESDQSFGRHGEAHNRQLEQQVADLHDRLEQASRRVGVNDIHSAALTAERDEALHQASVARERAQKTHAELDACQRELAAALQNRNEKDTLHLENTSLLATNRTLKQQHESAVQNSKIISSRYDKLQREHAAAVKENADLQAQLATIRGQNDALEEEKKLIADDHAGLELSNEGYFKEIKKLQAQVTARDNHIADLKKGISSRDDMIDRIQGVTTDTAIHELNMELETEVENLQDKVERQAAQLQEKETAINGKDGRIRALKEQNVHLTSENERLVQENEKLRGEYEGLKDEWLNDRHKVIRLNQVLTRNTTDYLKTLNDNTEDCVRLEENFKQKEATLNHKLDRREAAILKVKQLTRRITEISEQEFLGRTVTSTKATRIVEPSKTVESDGSGKSSAPANVDDDPTTEVHLTQGSDFASIMDNEVVNLKEVYRGLQDLRQPARQYTQLQSQQNTEPGPAGNNTVQTTDYDLPTLPDVPQIRRTGSDETGQATRTVASQSKAQPTGILKKSSQFDRDEENTGRFSVKSAGSVVSHKTDNDDDDAAGDDDDDEDDDDDNRSVRTAGTTNITTHRPAKSMSCADAKSPARPGPRARRNSDTGCVETEQRPAVDQTTAEPNTTSAFFMPDITLESNRRPRSVSADGRKGGGLSREARRVFDKLCSHQADNCHVCARVSAYGGGEKSGAVGGAEPSVRVATSSVAAIRVATTTHTTTITMEDIQRGKKTVVAERPTPVSDRTAAPATVPASAAAPASAPAYEDEPTMRPSMAPSRALAILIKETEDEIEHVQMQIRERNEAYFAHDKSAGRRERKRLMAEIKRLHAEVEARSGRLYRLHDVLEGQKQAGQLMQEDEVEVTVLSELELVRVTNTNSSSKNDARVTTRSGHAAGAAESTMGSKDGSWEGFD